MGRLAFRNSGQLKQLIITHAGEQMVIHLRSRNRRSGRPTILIEAPLSFNVRRSSNEPTDDEINGQQQLPLA